MSRWVLVVEDDPEARVFLVDALEPKGYTVRAVACASEALGALSSREFDVALLDVHLPDAHGIELLRMIQERQPSCSVLVMTGHATVESAVEAMRLGAFDYLEKPLLLDTLLLKLDRLFQLRSLEEEVASLRSKAEMGEFVGASRKALRFLDQVRTIAPTDVTVLLQGESGTGKELVGDLLHSLGPRKGHSIIKVNCGAIPETLMESELFGHEKGAFTGADSRKLGYLEMASGGTLFLDEVGEVPAMMQVKLLRALQERTIRRLGGTAEIPVDFRLISAANRDLQDLVQAGKFREDLYFRLNVVPLTIPPLRERKEDIPLLAQHFIQRHSRSHGLPPIHVSPEALEILISHRWPGNVRELENLIHRLQVLHAGRKILARHLPREMRRGRPGNGPVLTVVETGLRLRDAVCGFERRYIERVLDEEGGSKTAAAQRLGISRKNLWEKLSKGSHLDS